MEVKLQGAERCSTGTHVGCLKGFYTVDIASHPLFLSGAPVRFLVV